MLNPTKKKILHIQGQRRSSNKMVGGAKLHLESNPIPSRDAQRAQTKPGATRTHRPRRDWARCVYVSPAEAWVSSGLPWGQEGLWQQPTWEAWRVA